MDFQTVGHNLHQLSMDSTTSVVPIDRFSQRTQNMTNGMMTDFCEKIEDIPIFSIVCDSSFDRVVRRGQSLEETFQMIKLILPEKISELSRQYHKLTADIEMDKLTAVINSPKHHHQRLNNHYNHQLHRLITTMEEQLKDLQTQNKAELSKDINWRALKLMELWYHKHEDHPYPSEADVQKISNKGNIAVKDIETWFQFERIRRSKIIK